MKIQYRPEIDGLRAISVIAVIFYHLEIIIGNEKLFTGGFIGVDIFFVISGYLITSIIHKEIIQTKNISILNFYERRIRRILPILLTVSVSFLLLSYIYSLPTPLWKAAESILASIFFLGNFYFLNEHVSYGNDLSTLIPFLHTWSLSIEEQFYIIFPFIFFYIHKYLKKYLIHILILVLFTSLIANDYASKSWIVDLNNLSFYMLPLRGWEILSGCVLSVFEIKIKKKKSYLDVVIPKISFLIILYAIFFYDFEEIKPIPELILPILSTLTIIWYSSKDELITKILSWSPLVKTGLISYSLYLWHYPIFAFFRQTDINSTLFVEPIYKILLVLFVFLLSFITYKYIEKPFRNKKKISNNTFVKLLSLSVIFVIIFSFSAINTKGFKNRFSEFYDVFDNFEIDNRYLQAQWAKPLTTYYSENSKPFTNSNKKKILIVGNSHAVGFFNSLNLNQDLFRDYEFSLLRISLPDLKKKKLIEFKSAEYVILATRYNSLENIENFIDEWNSFLKFNDKKFIVILNRPEFKHNSSNNYSILDEKIYMKIIKKKNNLENFKNKISEQYYNLQDNNVIEFNNKLKIILNKKNIKYLDPLDYSCDVIKKKCDVLTNKNSKIYWDYAHYSIDGSRFFGKKIKSLNWLSF